MGKTDYGAAASGAAGGAAMGAPLGPWGIAGGAVLGAGLSLWGGSKKKKKKKISTLDKKQQRLNDDAHAAMYGEGPMADLYNYDPEQANAVFEQTVANPAYRNFNENIIPGITGQFRNSGIMNSSYTGDALAKSGRDVQESLNAERSRYLYGEQKDSRQAKRSAMETLQDRQTFAYQNPNSQNGGFDMGQAISGLDEGSKLWDMVDRYKGKV